MKRLLLAATLLSLTALTTACGPSVPVTNANPGPIENNENNTTPIELMAELDPIFVSGHLGNYTDCPDDGYTERNQGSTAKAEPAGDQAFGACAPSEDGDVDNCGGPLNCEAAQITVKVTNIGEEDAVGVSLETLGLVGDDNTVVATLPLIGAVDTDTNEAFDGELAKGESVTLRVDFQGPQDINEFIPSQNRWSGKAVLELTFGADNADDDTIRTKPVQVVGTVAT